MSIISGTSLLGFGLITRPHDNVVLYVMTFRSWCNTLLTCLLCMSHSPNVWWYFLKSAS